jgi:processing peptidase subunit alpha
MQKVSLIVPGCRGVGHVELERAKKAAISVISNALESKATSSEDIGRQFLTYGHRWVWERH